MSAKDDVRRVVARESIWPSSRAISKHQILRLSAVVSTTLESNQVTIDVTHGKDDALRTIIPPEPPRDQGRWIESPVEEVITWREGIISATRFPCCIPIHLIPFQ